MNPRCFSVTIHLPSFEEYLLNTDAVGSAPPDAFGPFRVLHQIGAGALGPVFRAYQPEQDRLVAVKLFRLDLPPEKTHQFVAELEKLIAADLTHPGIAAPLAAGISDVSAYLAQDFVAAESLDTVVRDMGRSDPADIARVASQLGGALDLAAAIGITHGALHPRDVLLSADDVRITGIGVTHALARVGVTAPIRRPYTAPERAAGGLWDRRADVFSLGALLFELLLRRRVVGAGDQTAESMKDVAGANTEALRRAFSRALAEDPGDRFATAGDFANAVQAAFSGKRTGSGRVSSRVRAVAVEPVHSRDEEPTVFVPTPFTPLPADELPLLTDSMLSADLDDINLAADDAPVPVGDLIHSGPSVIDHSAPLELGLSTGESRLSMIDAEPAADHRLADDHRLNGDKPSTSDFDVAEIFEPDIAEAASRPAPLETFESERSTQGVWPLMLALVVGIGLGFGMAVLLLGRDRVPSASQQAVSAVGQRAPVEIREEPIREFTERAVTEPASPPATAGSPPPAARPLAGATTEPTGPNPNPATKSSAKAPPPPTKPAAAPVVKPPVAKVPVSRPPVPKATPPRQATRPSAPAAAARTASRPAPAPVKAPPPVPAKTGPGSLAVDSRPAGASVFIDGKLVGTTPLVVATMGPGAHALHLDREGYRRWATAVRITPGERSRVAASLER